MLESHTDLEFIAKYPPTFQREFAKFFAQKQFCEFVAERQKIPLDPPSKEADVAHNHFIKVIYNTQLLKFASLGDLLIHAIKHRNFLSYGLAGRSLIEHVAVWYYYLTREYPPILVAGREVFFEDILKLIKVDKRFLFGTKFNWSEWLKSDHSALEAAYLRAVQDKKKRTPPQASSGQPVAPINVVTCVEKVAATLPKFGVFYDMFCDLVHPNLGSNILLYSISPQGVIGIDQSPDLQIGEKLIESTFKDLLVLTYYQVNELTKSHFSLLLGEQAPPAIVLKLSELGD